MRHYLLYSVLLHLLVLWGARLKRPPRAPQAPQEISIVYKEASGPLAGNGQSRTKQRIARAIPFAALVPKMRVKIQTEEDWTKDPDDGYQGGVGAFQTGGQTRDQVRFVASLWRMIDQYIEENPFLSEYNHTGEVSLSFEVDEAAHLVPKSLSAKAMDRVLKVIAVRAVRKALVNETGDVQPPFKRTWIHARFNWSSYQSCQSRRGYNGNQLSFCHYAENKKKTFSAGEKTATWVGAIYNHGPWAYEEIQKYQREESRRKSQFNPFTKYELDPDWNL